MIFFSVSLSFSKSCSMLLLNLMEKKHIKDHGSGHPWSPDLTWAFIFHLFCFVPKGQFHSRFMSLYWKTIEHFQSHKILWNHKSNALDPKLNLWVFSPQRYLDTWPNEKCFSATTATLMLLSYLSQRLCLFCQIMQIGKGIVTCFCSWKSLSSKVIENNFLPYKCSLYCTICSLIICGSPIPWFQKVSGLLNAAAFPHGGWSLPPLPPTLLGGSEQGGSEENAELLKPDCCVHLGTAATGKVHGRGTFVPTIEIISLEKYFA